MVGGHCAVIQCVEENLGCDSWIVEEVVGELHLGHQRCIFDSSMPEKYFFDGLVTDVGGGGRVIGN
jgi:hypothetical protein